MNNLVTKNTARITLICTADRGRPVVAALGRPLGELKPDRRKAADFVSVLSRFHIVGRSSSGYKSSVHASVLHKDQVHLSDVLWSAARRIRCMLPDSVIGALGIEFAQSLGAHKEVSSVYSIRLFLEAGNAEQEARWGSKTLPLHITMAIVNTNNTVMKKTPTSTPTEDKEYPQPPAFGVRFQQFPKAQQQQMHQQQPSKRKRISPLDKMLLLPCMPMCKYVCRYVYLSLCLCTEIMEVYVPP